MGVFQGVTAERLRTGSSPGHSNWDAEGARRSPGPENRCWTNGKQIQESSFSLFGSIASPTREGKIRVSSRVSVRAGRSVDPERTGGHEEQIPEVEFPPSPHISGKLSSEKRSVKSLSDFPLLPWIDNVPCQHRGGGGGGAALHHSSAASP